MGLWPTRAASDEESCIALKTLRARSFAAAQDDSIEGFFRSLFRPPLGEVNPPLRIQTAPLPPIHRKQHSYGSLLPRRAIACKLIRPRL